MTIEELAKLLEDEVRQGGRVPFFADDLRAAVEVLVERAVRETIETVAERVSVTQREQALKTNPAPIVARVLGGGE